MESCYGPLSAGILGILAIVLLSPVLVLSERGL